MVWSNNVWAQDALTQCQNELSVWQTYSSANMTAFKAEIDSLEADLSYSYAYSDFLTTEFANVITQLRDLFDDVTSSQNSTILNLVGNLTECHNTISNIYTGECDFFSCPAGTYRIGNAVTGFECEPCEPGTFSMSPVSKSSTSCRSCPVGTFSPNMGSVECHLCPAGAFSNITGAISCIPCPMGTYSAEGQSKCWDCPVGTYSRGGMTWCIPCDPGTYSNSTGSGVCKPCLSGEEQKVSGAISCNSCGVDI